MEILHLVVLLSTIPSLPTRTCFDASHLPYVQEHKKVLWFPLLETPASRLDKCAEICSSFKACRSFNYHQTKNMCYLFEVDSLHSSFQSIYCIDYLYADMNKWPKKLLGECGYHECKEDEICIPGRDTYTCTKLGTPTSCQELQMCHPGLPDGEYWLYPTVLGGRRVRMYCYNMDTMHPKEYVTLPYPNTGFYPGVENPSCEGERPVDSVLLQYAGTRTFDKIRIDIKSLRVDRKDTTFAHGAELLLPYGEARDCYTAHPGGGSSSCGPRGNFTLDFRGTGLMLEPGVVWKSFGTSPHSDVIKESASRVHLRCGGYCGGCVPTGLYLQLGQEMPIQQARQLYCPPPLR